MALALGNTLLPNMLGVLVTCYFKVMSKYMQSKLYLIVHYNDVKGLLHRDDIFKRLIIVVDGGDLMHLGL